MTLEQFKIWFEGFCEATGDSPTPEQFAKIRARVASLDTPPKQAGLMDWYRETRFAPVDVRPQTVSQLDPSRQATCGVIVKPDPDHKIQN